MSGWNVEEPLEDEYVGTPPSPLASLLYLTNALRRRWRTWVTAGVLGMVLVGAYTWQFPPESTATVGLSLQHPSGTDAASQMQNDVVILMTRQVAGRTLAALHEDITTDKLLKNYTGTAKTSTILEISVRAHSPEQAVRTATALAKTYLAYRADQLRISSTAAIAGVQSQIASLQSQLAAAQAQYTQFENDPAQSRVASTALQQTTALRSQIGALQTTVQSAQSATNSLISSSVVLDPPAVVPTSRALDLALILFAGAVGGMALGVAAVVLDALLSTRLRRREDIALAAGAPVTHSVPRLRSRSLTRTPRAGSGKGGRAPAAAYGLHVLAQGLMAAVDDSATGRVALVTLDNEEDGLAVAAFAGAELTSERRQVFLVDLSRSGRMAERVDRAVGAAVRPSAAPTTYRPEVPAPFARGPLAEAPGRRSDLGHNDPTRARWDAADVVLAVAPGDLDTGLDHLAGWADSAVLLVTAGRSTAETIASTAGLLRSAGLAVGSVLVIGSDGTDRSLGRLQDAADAADAATPTGSTAAASRGRVLS
jgi:capsular polysaccharide biosynthesis protein